MRLPHVGISGGECPLSVSRVAWRQVYPDSYSALRRYADSLKFDESFALLGWAFSGGQCLLWNR